MPRLSTLIAIFICLYAVAPAHARDGGRYGEVRLATPTGTPRGYVVLFSDAGGWTPADQVRLDSLAGAGALAVGVDTDAYLARVATEEARCDQLVGDVEGLSRRLQREHGGAEYFFPILAGVGEGGALAGAIMAQTPPATLGGAVSLDPWAVVQTSHGFCTRFPSDGVEPRHWRVPILNRFWSVALTPATSGITRAHFETLQALSPDLEVQTLSARRPDQTLASLVAPHLVQDDFSRVGGLPLVELPASKPSRLMAVFLSGDGGWRDIDKTIAENLQSLGVSVVGWDSVRYFWQSKTPQQTAADLSAVILAYSAKWHADKVALIGFSFGADTLPFVYDYLRPSLKQHVAMISLLSLGRAADWEIRVVGWLGAGPSAAATPLAPAIKDIPGKMIQCFYGDQDSGSYCPDLVKQGAEVIEKKGVHHFDGNYIYMAHQILDGFKRRIEN
ncbi:MAG TPA: AcvB/VirJ family lysyl-phosphatidylglycerol hydrolase [Roseiarcus sp.]|jgi:type IV secretory pathway VirJ component